MEDPSQMRAHPRPGAALPHSPRYHNFALVKEDGRFVYRIAISCRYTWVVPTCERLVDTYAGRCHILGEIITRRAQAVKHRCCALRMASPNWVLRTAMRPPVWRG